MGLNQLDLDNSPEKRKALCKRLETAGCDVDLSGSDYLSTESGGKFPDLDDESFFHTISSERQDETDRGRFTNFGC